MSYKFKVGDSGFTKTGYAYRVVIDDLKNEYPVVAVVTYEEGFESPVIYTADGRYKPYECSEADLVPPTRTLYVNVYPGLIARVYENEVYAREAADPSALAIAYPIHITQDTAP